MQFLLRNIFTGYEILLLEGKEYIVGRVPECDICITGDSSISRKHATVKVTADQVIVTDCEAKYNTFVNDVKLAPNMPYKLNLNDKVHFGIVSGKSVFELAIDLSKFKYVTTTTNIGGTEKEYLKKVVGHCGGIVVDKWSQNCTHLTMDKIVLSEKVLEALVDGKPFVTSDYWIDLEKSLVNPDSNPPDIRKYNRPPIAQGVNVVDIEENIFEYRVGRRSLFNNMVFVFATTKKKDVLNKVIGQCGGESIAWQENPLTVHEIQKSTKTYVIIGGPDNEYVAGFSEFIQEYENNGKRSVAINEIPMAIVKCSTEQNCNPHFDRLNHVLGSRVDPQQQPGNTGARVVPETEETNQDHFDGPGTVPPTFGSQIGELAPASSSSQSNQNDVAMVEENDQSYSGKRRYVEENDIDTNKKMKMQIDGAGDEGDGPVHPSSKRANSEERTDDAKKMRLGKSIGRTQDFIQVSSKKRKAVDLAAEFEKSLLEEESKKSTQPNKVDANDQENPFESMMVKKPKFASSSASNPFAMARKPKIEENAKSGQDNGDLQENPFKKIISAKMNSTKGDLDDQDKENPSKSVCVVKKEENNPNWGADTTKRSAFGLSWMSKMTANIKKENAEKVKQEDPEITKIIEIFKDAMQVKTLALEEYQRHDVTVNNTTHDVTDGDRKVNFKKFRKVAPLNPQINVITRSQLIKVGPGKTSAIDIARRNAEGSDEDGEADDGQTQTCQKKKIIL